MNSYETGVIGDIVIIRNLIFQDGFVDKKVCDYAWNRGRPCLIVYSDDEYDYFLVMSSSKSNYKFRERNFQLLQTDFQYKRNLRRDFVNLERIYKIPISRHNTVGKVKFDAYKRIVCRFKEYHGIVFLEDILDRSLAIRKVR